MIAERSRGEPIHRKYEEPTQIGQNVYCNVENTIADSDPRIHDKEKKTKECEECVHSDSDDCVALQRTVQASVKLHHCNDNKATKETNEEATRVEDVVDNHKGKDEEETEERENAEEEVARVEDVFWVEVPSFACTVVHLKSKNGDKILV